MGRCAVRGGEKFLLDTFLYGITIRHAHAHTVASHYKHDPGLLVQLYPMLCILGIVPRGSIYRIVGEGGVY